MYSVHRNITNLVYESMNCKYNWNLFPFCFGLLVDFMRLAWVEFNSLLTINSHLLVNMIDQIPYTNCKYIYYSLRKIAC